MRLLKGKEVVELTTKTPKPPFGDTAATGANATTTVTQSPREPNSGCLSGDGDSRLLRQRPPTLNSRLQGDVG